MTASAIVPEPGNGAARRADSRGVQAATGAGSVGRTGLTPPPIALVSGGTRSDNLVRAFEAVADRIDWPTRQRVLIKPNLVAPHRPLSMTHPDALDSVLAAVRRRYSGDLTVADGSAVSPTSTAYARLGYDAICRRHDASLIDLNDDDAAPIEVFAGDMSPLTLRMAKTVLDSDCRISLSIPKTHDTVLVTLGIKNMIMGGLVNRRLASEPDRPLWRDLVGRALNGHGNGWGSDKMAMHHTIPTINLNLAILAGHVMPHLTLLDGYESMEGEGPIDGTAVPWQVAIAGIDALATDLYTARLMGYDRPQVGYLEYCARLGLGHTDLATVELRGNAGADSLQRQFRPHPEHQRQRQWHIDGADALLARYAPPVA